MTIPRLESLGLARDGQEIVACTLEAANGMRMRVLNLGGIVQSLQVPDAEGALADVVLGFDDPGDYLDNRFYLGAIIGRYANRIAGASFVLDGKTIPVTANQGRNHLHGGRRGFDAVRWAMTPFALGSARGVAMVYTSAAGEEGFPGTLVARVTYTLTDAGEWDVVFYAESDSATPVSLTQHSYFNLAGGGSALDHLLTIPSEHYLPQDAEQIPTGAVDAVSNTGFDLRRARSIRDVLCAPELASAGLDHSFVLPYRPDSLVTAAQLLHTPSGRELTVSTTAPSVHCYTGTYLQNVRGKKGAQYGPTDAICLETQQYPDSPNKPQFPTCIVRPELPYESRTRFAFTARAAVPQ